MILKTKTFFLHCYEIFVLESLNTFISKTGQNTMNVYGSKIKDKKIYLP